MKKGPIIILLNGNYTIKSPAQDWHTVILRRGIGWGQVSGLGSEDIDAYVPVPVFTTLSVGVGFSVMRFTDSRLLSSAIFAYICVVDTFL